MTATPEPPPTRLARTTLQYHGVLVPKLGCEPDVTARLVYACVSALELQCYSCSRTNPIADRRYKQYAKVIEPCPVSTLHGRKDFRVHASRQRVVPRAKVR